MTGPPINLIADGKMPDHHAAEPLRSDAPEDNFL